MSTYKKLACLLEDWNRSHKVPHVDAFEGWIYGPVAVRKGSARAAFALTFGARLCFKVIGLDNLIRFAESVACFIRSNIHLWLRKKI